MIPEQEAREALSSNYIFEKERGRGGMAHVKAEVERSKELMATISFK